MADMTTEQLILDAAKKKFNEIGIAQVTMNILAEETGYARRTIYRYFDSKEDVAYKVMLSYMDIWNRAQKHLFNDLEGDGLSKLQALLLKLLDYMLENIHLMRFLSDFDNYFKDSAAFKPDEQLEAMADQSFHLSDSLFERIIDEGLEDNSIQLPDDKKMILATITNVLWNFGLAIAVRGDHIGKDAGVDAIEMFRCQVRLYVAALGN